MIDGVTNFMLTIPIYKSRSEELGDALIEHVFCKYSIPECVITNHDSVFISIFINYLFMRLGIKIKTVAPYNYVSLQAEHGIKSLGTILTNIWQD